MKDAGTMMIDEFLSRLEAHETFYLKGTGSRVILHLTYSDGYVVEHFYDGIQGFLDTADHLTVSTFDDRIIYFSNAEGKVTFMIRRDAWEVEE